MSSKSERWKKVLTVVFCLSLAGCIPANRLPLRFYNLQSGQVISAQLTNTADNRGSITATLPDGKSLTGKYSVVEYTGRTYRFEKFMSGGKKSEVEKPFVTEPSETDAKLWPDVYGFGRAATAKPVATATLVGNQGTVIEVVFYSLNLDNGSGSGVGRDNAGNWYRVYVGELER